MSIASVIALITLALGCILYIVGVLLREHRGWKP